MEQKRPRGREKFVSGKSATVTKKDTAQNFGGPAGNTHGYESRKNDHSRPKGVSRAARAGGGGGILLVLLVLYFLFNGNGQSAEVLSGVLGELSGQGQSPQTVMTQLTQAPIATAKPKATATPAAKITATPKTESDASAVRPKYTALRGNGKDTVTIMVYMCGTDLESRYGMATKDLNEMLNAGISDKINLIVETGGCSRWQNSLMSNSVNQIYKVQANGLVTLKKDFGKKSMTDPKNLSEFIRFCAEEYPADRYALIMWDHGGGSVSGYGYDETMKSRGSMTLDRFGTALEDGGVKFDFIGFDACLMATIETCIVCEPYADYLIASEETEPGVGWYYTEWLKELSSNTSTATVKLGKKIVDTFTEECSRKVPSDKTTLSVIDLAEFGAYVPEALRGFAMETTRLAEGQRGGVVMDARAQTREFSSQSKIDQVDMIDLALRIGTPEAKKLAEAVARVVKYNRTSRSMSHANGLSVYFPYKKSSAVSNAVAVYDKIGMEKAYTECIKNYGSLNVGGQAASYQMGSSGLGGLYEMLLGTGNGGGAAANGDYYGGSLIGSLFGSMQGDVPVGDIGSLFGTLLGNRSIPGSEWLNTELISANEGLISESVLSPEDLKIVNRNGRNIVAVPEDRWQYVSGLALNVFFDDGEGGYIDLGVDNTFEFDDEGNLLAEYDGTWLALDGHIVPYYLSDTEEDAETGAYCYRGYVPALFTGTRTESGTGKTIEIERQRVEIMIVFDDSVPRGKVVGFRPVYTGGETETIAKGGILPENGDMFSFVCDYYSENGDFENNYELNDPWIVNGEPSIENMTVEGGGLFASYRFTDRFGNEYWTEKF